MQEYLKLLPAIHHLQKHASTQKLMNKHQIDLETITIYLKEHLAFIRNIIINNQWSGIDPRSQKFYRLYFSNVNLMLKKQFLSPLQPVINASGTVLHTNLGRSRLSEPAIAEVVRVARNYSNLEMELSSGKRNSRHEIVENLLKDLTGAEAAMVVNNNAAAVYLILKALAKNKEIIVSRGELVEIGGSFRIPNIMEESGAKLQEVGTTNKTRLKDYENAINHETAMLMKVHRSNFEITGFTESVERDEICQLAEARQLISYENLGSGTLFDFSQQRIGHDVPVHKVIASGVDIVSFSGDKLLGGPQAGIILGKKSLIDKLKTHSLARVLRVDKLTLAALSATLITYKKGTAAVKEIPTIRDIIISEEEIKDKVKYFVNELCTQHLDIQLYLKRGRSTIGGGTMPGVMIPTILVGFSIKGYSAAEIYKRLCENRIAIIGKVHQDTFWLDFRTVDVKDITTIAKIIEMEFSTTNESVDQ